MRRLIDMGAQRQARPPSAHTSLQLADINEAYRVFGRCLDGVMKVAVTP
jgi:hypothetical protein